MEGVVPMNKAMAMSVAVLLLFDFAYSAIPCASIATQFQPCIVDIQSKNLLPSTACCIGLLAIQSFETQFGVNPACNCTKGVMLKIPGLIIDVKFSNNIQSSCNVSLGFSLSTATGC